jgi:hypothetical protein
MYVAIGFLTFLRTKITYMIAIFLVIKLMILFGLAAFTRLKTYIIYNKNISIALSADCLVSLILLAIDYTKIDENGVKH